MGPQSHQIWASATITPCISPQWDGYRAFYFYIPKRARRIGSHISYISRFIAPLISGWSDFQGHGYDFELRPWLGFYTSLFTPLFYSRNNKNLLVPLNNHFLMDVWWNNHVLCNDLESSNWSKHKKQLVLDFQATLQISKVPLKPIYSNRKSTRTSQINEKSSLQR